MTPINDSLKTILTTLRDTYAKRLNDAIDTGEYDDVMLYANRIAMLSDIIDNTPTTLVAEGDGYDHLR